MKRIFVVILAVIGTLGIPENALAEIWTGCVSASNTSGVDVTLTVDSSPGWSWPLAASDKDIKFLKAGDQFITMQADRSSRPPIHAQPSQIGMIWNFFTGEHADNRGCVNEWRIVIIRSPCNNVVDNICQ